MSIEFYAFITGLTIGLVAGVVSTALFIKALLKWAGRDEERSS